MAKTTPPLTSPDDIVQAYALGLGRAPESAQVIEAFFTCSLPFTLGVFFHGPEFTDTVRAAVARDRRLSGNLFNDLPSEELKAWAADRLPLTPAGAEAVRQAADWLPLYQALFSDPGFTDDPDIGGSPFSAGEWARLEAMADDPVAHGSRAVVEEITPAGIRGWAANPHAMEAPLTVEFWIDGAFAGAMVADQFRRDVQDRFGGSGRFGFRFDTPPHGRGRVGGRLELRLPGGAVLAEADLTPQASAEGRLDGVRGELRAIREALVRLESTTAHLESENGAPLSHYTEYRERYRHHPEPASSQMPAKARAAVTVVMDATDATADILADALDAVVRQSVAGWTLVLHGLDPDVRLLAEDQWRRWRASGGLPACAGDLVIAADLTQALAMSTSDVVLLDAWTVLEPEAIDLMLSELLAGASAVYADEDELADVVLGPIADAPRTAPSFKPGLDPDLLHQIPYVGACLAFRRACLGRTPPRPAAGPLAGADVLLRMTKVGQAEDIRHLPVILSSRRPRRKVAATAWIDCVRSALDGRSVEVTAHADPLGGGLTDASRVGWPAGGTATVIIPTHDRLDLLKPCIDSLLATTAEGKVTLDLLIVDHQCEDAATVAYLADLVSRGLARVQRIECAFNWALLNNLAAATSTSDVLVFLNDDTVALHAGWLDELCAQAMRPEVGVVGARLLYQDGTIQHAGLLARDQVSNFLVHESVGQPGEAPGYLGRNVLLRQAAAVTGACLAIRRELFEAIGGFDAVHYPVEANDVDLCFRVRERGLRILYDPYATLYHLESKSRGFSRSGPDKAIADQAAQRIWTQWAKTASTWDGYPAVFDRWAAPFTRLRPPRRWERPEPAPAIAPEPSTTAPASPSRLWREAVTAAARALKASLGRAGA